jgi:hypothetical protein
MMVMFSGKTEKSSFQGGEEEEGGRRKEKRDWNGEWMDRLPENEHWGADCVAGMWVGVGC